MTYTSFQSHVDQNYGIVRIESHNKHSNKTQILCFQV
jgi:hypothetical protein